MKPSKSLQTIIEAVICSSIFILLLGVTTYLLYSKSLNALEEQIKIGLVSTVKASASTLDGAAHLTFDEETMASDESYALMAKQMEMIRRSATDVRYIYTSILEDGEVYFMVNPSPQNDADGDGLPDPPPALMTLYDDAPTELKKSLENQSIEISTYRDQWGSFISAYAPFYSVEGDFAGILAMDLEVSRFQDRLENIERVFDKAKIIILFLGLIVGLIIWWIRRSQVNHLNTIRHREADAKEKLSRAHHLNVLLSGLTTYFYRRIPREIIKHTPRIRALYHYSQSLRPLAFQPDTQPVQDWFHILDQNTYQRCKGFHEWHIPLQSEAVFTSNKITEELTHLHAQLARAQSEPLRAETHLLKEHLDCWAFSTHFYLEESSELSELHTLINNEFEHITGSAYMTQQTPNALGIMSTINRLRQMGFDLVSGEENRIELIWKVYKENSA
ncbi:hypothetical protein MADA3029_450023 [Vibrio nigripulchritudo MADA3029]|uniref:cache domain-containing protein n=1 Tax=Vibrio nigripulchritudo TaxID=28173 RepID=UPI0003B2005D|nr:cache domain-containing protein [Vibrio nigripulchritudo]CCN46025.1 hypothetical protein VIBNIMADA3020_1190005 [Vibrio nigripulchritudo MADA3020]CCN54324.1 hypothetical protein VIBNIMADA3021_530023 [Vibrio nigripulchritudo MADA3021]CCN59625.1 hypothetical protein MADA3029_450023 [Vibrio nigripulchritudo MADA3029]